MAVFEQAIEETLKWEGGYVFNPSDPGGETNFGVSKSAFPNLDIKHLTKAQAIEIYRNHEWKSYLEQIKSQVIANKIFDITVNGGERRAVLITQKALNDCSFKTDVDGFMGGETISGCNKIEEIVLISAIRNRHKLFYIELIQRKPNLKVFEKGWLKRAAS